MKAMFPLVGLALFVLSPRAGAETAVPERLERLKPREVRLALVADDRSGSRWAEVRAALEFPHPCLAPEEKLFSRTVEGDQISYALYARADAERICVTKVLPVERDLLLDRIELSEGEAIPQVDVNGVPARVHSL